MVDEARKREYDREYYQKNREKIREYYQKNREKILKYQRDNREKHMEYDRRYYQKNREARLEYRRKRTYGITPEEYTQMLLDQEGGCAICGCPSKGKMGLVIDHDHATGKVRGLLCSGCNTRIGHLESELVGASLEYLNRKR